MLLAVISQITEGSLDFSGVGVGFFVMYFSVLIARQIQIQVSESFILPRRQSNGNFQLT